MACADMIADSKTQMHTEAKARPNAVMREAVCGEKSELVTQYRDMDCKKGRCKLPSLRGGVGGQTGNTGMFPNIDNGPASCRLYIFENSDMPYEVVAH